MLLAFPAIVSAQHTGKVFVDANYNGRWDKGERNIGFRWIKRSFNR